MITMEEIKRFMFLKTNFEKLDDKERDNFLKTFYPGKTARTPKEDGRLLYILLYNNKSKYPEIESNLRQRFQTHGILATNG